MEKIKIDYTETIARQVEIELPCYSIGQTFAYMVTPEKTIIQVDHYFLGIQTIRTGNVGLVFANTQTICTEKEFKEKYFEVKNKLSELVGL